MINSNDNTPAVNLSQTVHALRHLETGEYICLRHEGDEHLAAFTDGDSAFQFREELGLLEHVDVSTMSLDDAPFDHFWLDGAMIAKTTLPRGNVVFPAG